MLTRITKISLLFLSIAYGGLLAATMHYHGDAILCLEHGNTPHITSNEQLCPVSVLNLDNDAVNPSITQIFITSDEPLLLFPEKIELEETYRTDQGRAPPVLA